MNKLLVAVLFIFVISSSSVFAYDSYFNNAGYDEEFKANALGVETALWPFEVMSKSWTGANVSMSGVNRSGVAVFHNSTGSGNGIILLMSSLVSVNTSNPVSVGVEFAINDITGLNLSTSYVYVTSGSDMVGQKFLTDLTANHWYYASFLIDNATSTNGVMKVGLSLPMWTFPSDVTIYISRVVMGSVDTDEVWDVMPDAAYGMALCNDGHSGWFPHGSYSTNVSGLPFTIRVFNLSDTADPCVTFYYNGLLSVRAATGGFNGTYGWNHRFEHYSSYSYEDYSDAFYVFTKSYFYSIGTLTTCTGGYGCPSQGGAVMFNFINSSRVIGTSLGYWFAGPPSYNLCEEGILAMNGSQGYMEFCQYFSGYRGSTNLALNSSTDLILSGMVLVDSDGNPWRLSAVVPAPLNLSEVNTCNGGWRCNEGSEYYLTTGCAKNASNVCGACGCGTDGRCLSDSIAGTWICHSGSEAWHYNSSCINDLQLACDYGCSAGVCLGEQTCADDGGCLNGCVGSTWYWGSTCNLTSYSCTVGSSQVCPNGCLSGGCNVAVHIGTLFPDADAVTPTNAISSMYLAVLGFVNRVGGPFMVIMFLLIGIIIVTLVFGAFGKILKDAFS